MKRIIFFICLLAFGLHSCSPKVIPPSGEVNYVSTGDGTITVNTIGYGSTETDAFINAERNAIDAILFRGIPSSEQKTALIGSNESEIKNKYSDYFYDFYSNYRYKTFVTSTIPISDVQKAGGGTKAVSADVTVNLRSLRADLEDRGLIRKFGF